jgi:uncharacterized membrane protein
MTPYAFALFAHILVVVYLLGADIGRVYLARLGASADSSDAAVQLAARGVLWLGSATNLALVLILPAGISLGGALGAYRIVSPAWLVGTWAVAAAWALLSILADRSAGVSDRRSLRIADMVFRLILVPGFLYDGAMVFLGTSQTVEAEWLALKIMLYGLLILISMPSRWFGFRLRRALANGDAQGSRTALGRITPPLLLGWPVILLAAWLGVAKPV